MKNFNFEKIVKTYEKKRSTIPSYEKRQTKEEEQIIRVDIERTFLNIQEIDEHEREILRKILYEVLILMPIEYTQGMSEIAAIFVYFYFREEIESTEDDEIVIDSQLLKKVRITITNMFTDKYVPVIENEFKMYLHYNKVFMRMMAKRGYELNEEECLKYMNITLTWFTRLVVKFDDMTMLVGYILACPTSIPFLLLVKFFDQADKKEKIETFDDDLYEQLIDLEREFLDTEATMAIKKPVIGPKEIVIGGAIIALTAAVFYKVYKKEE